VITLIASYESQQEADIMISQAASSLPGVEIRQLNVDDLELFRDIRTEAVHKYPQMFGSPEEDQGGEVMSAAYRRWLTGTMLGAFEDQTLIGIAGFYASSDKKSQHRGHIYTVYVREGSRGKGFGDSLIKNLLVLAEALVDQVHLAVLLTATDAVKTYERNGFEIYGLDPRVVRIGELEYDQYLMLKRFR
jgi:ribosomal protein S18 acetylase RimI-like enzyme